MAQPVSSCTCPLEEGVWGRSGWHFRYVRLGDIPKEMRTIYNSETNRDEPISEAKIESIAATYRGKWVAVERCPHYWRAVAKEELY